MDPASPPRQASPFATATFKKAIDVIAHYVDFSDHSSSWSGSPTEDFEAESPRNVNEELHSPLLHSDSAELAETASVDSSGQPAHVADVQTLPAAKASLASEESQASTMHVQSPHSSPGETRFSSSNDGAHTPTKEDLRTPLLSSQPVDHGIASPTQCESPKVPPSRGLENLGSGLLNPSLLEQLLDDHAPLPNVPHTEIRHAVPVVATGHPGKLQDSVRYLSEISLSAPRLIMQAGMLRWGHPKEK